MKKLLALVALVLVVSSTSSLAAVGDWTGFHVGGSIGVVEHTPYWNDVDFDWFGATLQLPHNGLLYGAVVGYDWQPDTMVYGVELTLNFVSAENFTRYSDDVDITEELKALHTLTGRVGVPAGNALLYAKFGAAMADAEHSWIEDNDPTDSWDSIDNGNLGYVLGVGVEHKFSDLISLKIEYSKADISEEAEENRNGFTMRVGEEVESLVVGLNFAL